MKRAHVTPAAAISPRAAGYPGRRCSPKTRTPRRPEVRRRNGAKNAPPRNIIGAAPANDPGGKTDRSDKQGPGANTEGHNPICERRPRPARSSAFLARANIGSGAAGRKIRDAASGAADLIARTRPAMTGIRMSAFGDRA
ncbi:hypothetical protein GCM10027271_07260 [Saccharopolyspora gloriosae]